MITKQSWYLKEGDYIWYGIPRTHTIVVKVLRFKIRAFDPVIVIGQVYGHQSIMDGGKLEFSVSDTIKVLDKEELTLFLMNR